MNCGCGGACCQENRGLLAAVAGLASIAARPQSSGLGFLFAESGGGDWWDWNNGGGDFWGFDDSFWGFSGGGGFVDPYDDLTDEEFAYLCSVYGCGDTVGTFTDWDTFLPAPAGRVPLVSQPNNWWDGFLPSFGGGNVGTPSAPALPGYCPAGYYHPLDDPYNCVPFPLDPAQRGNTQPRPRPRQTAQRPAQPKQAATKVSPQNPQPCPAPGQTDPATGKCKCPTGYLYDANKRQCVKVTLSNRLVAPVGESGVPLWVWIVGGVLLVKAVKK